MTKRKKAELSFELPSMADDPYSDLDQYFPTQLQRFQYLDKYSRYRYDLGRRETWNETVDRAVDYMRWLSKGKLSERDYKEIHHAILNLHVMPSMRLLAMAGDAAKRDEKSIMNCAYVAIDSLDALVEMLSLSMSGVGIGFSVEERYTSQLPRIKRQSGTFSVFIIPDSTEGWCTALRAGLTEWYNGRDVVFDYSQIRKAGEPLRTKGGRSSGSGPLKELLDFTRGKIVSRGGTQLRPIDIYDIATKIGDCVIQGGVRRVATLCMFDYDDEMMLNAKSGDFWKHSPWRFNSNNSAVVEKELSLDEVRDFMLRMDASKNGEPGIVNRLAMKNTMPERRNKEHEFGTNACQPGWATVLTPDGIRTIDDIDVGDIIWSGEGWTEVARKLSSGNKSVYAYKFSNGTFVGTDDHHIFSGGEEVEAGEAESADGLAGLFANDIVIDPQDVMDGLVLGDGTVHKASNNLVYLIIGEKDMDYFNSEISHLIKRDRTAAFRFGWEIDTTISARELPYTYLRKVPDRFFYGDKNKIAGFLRGLFSANGSVVDTKGYYRIGLKQSSETLVRQVQIMLSSLGIRSYITINKPKSVEFRNGVYAIKQSYDINISTDRHKFMTIIGFVQKYKQRGADAAHESRKLVYGTLQEIEPLGVMPVYDLTVLCNEHSYWTGGIKARNCGEVILKNAEFCNLSSVVCRPEDDVNMLVYKVRVATIIGTIQSLAENYEGLRPVWGDNQRDERLLGVDLNGQMDCPEARKPEVQDFLRQHAIDINAEYAAKMGINASASITTVKPSGNSGVMLDISSGLHPRWSQYYIRNVRINKGSPLYRVLKDSGVKLVPENGQEEETGTTFVAGFPMKSPDGAVTRHGMNALEQLEYWKSVKLHWTELNPSCTIYYSEDELDSVIEWVYSNQDVIGGLSFLPRFDMNYENAPYIEIDAETYEQMSAEFPKIKWGLLAEYEKSDLSSSGQEVACSAGVCDFKL
jgi:hypothetical protein